MGSNTFDEAIHPTLTRDAVGAEILAHTFVFARTMPQWPHEYILRKNWTSEIPWENVVQFLRDDGVTGWFGEARAKRKYWRYAGKRYWTMGDTLAGATLINRDEDVPVDYLTLEGDDGLV